MKRTCVQTKEAEKEPERKESFTNLDAAQASDFDTQWEKFSKEMGLGGPAPQAIKEKDPGQKEELG